MCMASGPLRTLRAGQVWHDPREGSGDSRQQRSMESRNSRYRKAGGHVQPPRLPLVSRTVQFLSDMRYDATFATKEAMRDASNTTVKIRLKA